jgi:hypothetical protein
MTTPSVDPRPPKNERPTGWGALLAILENWGSTGRMVVLSCIPIAAVVAIVALVVIYLGAIGVGALLLLEHATWGFVVFRPRIPR